MAEPPPTPREQAVEAAHRQLHLVIPGAGNPCPWPEPSRDVLCSSLKFARELVADVWPFAERAALDRAEKALRNLADRQPPTDTAQFQASAIRISADLVASLRPEEPG